MRPDGARTPRGRRGRAAARSAASGRRGLVDTDVPRGLQQRDLLRQHGIADVDAVPDQAELCSVDADQGGDGEPDRVDQQVVQVVPGMRTGYA